MNPRLKEQIDSYIAENLTIKLEEDFGNDPYYSGKDIIVKLLLKGEVISESSITVPE